MTLTAATTAGATTRGPVLEKIWLQHYPAGVPAEINPSEYRSLRELIEQAIAQHRDRPCFTCMDRTLTYGDLDVLASRFAAYLQQVARLRKGDRIALMLPNVLQYPVAILGAFRAGLTIVNTNPMYTPRELQHQLHDSGARAILILENFAHTLAEVQHDVHLDTVIVTGVGDLLAFPKSLLVNFALRHVKKQVPEYSLPGAVSLTEALSKGRYENLERVELGHEDIAFLQYTGGTTGVSKGAVLTHRNLIANVLQSEAWIRPQLDPDAGADRDHGAAAVSHLRAHGEQPDDDQARRAQHPDSEPARLRRLRARSWRGTASRSSRASTRSSMRCCTRRASTAWISAGCA